MNFLFSWLWFSKRLLSNFRPFNGARTHFRSWDRVAKKVEERSNNNHFKHDKNKTPFEVLSLTKKTEFCYPW